jgi:hypothetical protein
VRVVEKVHRLGRVGFSSCARLQVDVEEVQKDLLSCCSILVLRNVHAVLLCCFVVTKTVDEKVECVVVLALLAVQDGALNVKVGTSDAVHDGVDAVPTQVTWGV